MKLTIFLCFGFLLLGDVSLALSAEDEGESLYAANCSVCHRPKGEGIENVFPPLQDNAYVLGDPAILVQTVLEGRGGMPSYQSSLNDQQLSQLISYVRKNFGNNGDAVSPALINQVRTSGSEKITSDHDVQ